MVKCRSPNMRHVPRTHRIDLDWLFERFRNNEGIFVKYVNAKLQIADMLTKGSFTTIAWQSMLKLANLTNQNFKIKPCNKDPVSAPAPNESNKTNNKPKPKTKSQVRAIYNIVKPKPMPKPKPKRKRKDGCNFMAAARCVHVIQACDESYLHSAYV